MKRNASSRPPTSTPIARKTRRALQRWMLIRSRWGAESFFLAHEWAPLPPTRIDGCSCSNGEYNAMFGLPRRYLEHAPPPGPEHLRERIPEVVRLATQPNAKLQYFQTMFDFT